MTWARDVERLIAARWQVGETFQLKDAYEFADELSQSYPTNRHLTDGIRVALQHLRKEGRIEMLEPGHYRRVR